MLEKKLIIIGLICSVAMGLISLFLLIYRNLPN